MIGGLLGSMRRVSIAVLLLVAPLPSLADSADAVRAIDEGDCAGAGIAINEGLQRSDARAFMLAGYLYQVTGCVVQDLPRAARLYQRSVELGDKEARNFLGLMYAMGHGVPQDYRTAYHWFTYGDPPPLANDDKQVVYGYALAITQLARSHVQYPKNSSREDGTIFVTLHTRTGDVTFSRGDGTGERELKYFERSLPFRKAIADAYEDAVKQMPRPEGIDALDTEFMNPWTFRVN